MLELRGRNNGKRCSSRGRLVGLLKVWSDISHYVRSQRNEKEQTIETAVKEMKKSKQLKPLGFVEVKRFKKKGVKYGHGQRTDRDNIQRLN
jgi:hypothetical protein